MGATSCRLRMDSRTDKFRTATSGQILRTDDQGANFSYAYYRRKPHVSYPVTTIWHHTARPPRPLGSPLGREPRVDPRAMPEAGRPRVLAPLVLAPPLVPGAPRPRDELPGVCGALLGVAALDEADGLSTNDVSVVMNVASPSISPGRSVNREAPAACCSSICFARLKDSGAGASGNSTQKAFMLTP